MVERGNMKASIIRIGNSQGIRIPKLLIEQCGFEGDVELEVHNNELVIKSVSHPRQNWEEAFIAMEANADDALLESVASEWDEVDWEWK